MRCTLSTITGTENDPVTTADSTEYPADPTEPSVTDTTDAPNSDNTQYAPLDIRDLEILAEELAAFVKRKIAEIPTPDATLAARLDGLEAKIDSILAMVSAQPRTEQLMTAIGMLTDAMTAPKTIVTDATGKPVGIKLA
jgi:hypothetical protein